MFFTYIMGVKYLKQFMKVINFNTIHESNKSESSLCGWGQYFYVTILCFQNAFKQVGFTKQTVSKVTDLKCSIIASVRLWNFPVGYTKLVTAKGKNQHTLRKL